MTAYGTAVRKLSNGELLDVELADSREDAHRLVDEQNERIRDWDTRIEWVVVKLEVAA